MAAAAIAAAEVLSYTHGSTGKPDTMGDEDEQGGGGGG